MPRYPHLIVPTAPEALRYTSPKGGGSSFSNPPRQRAQHARKLIGEFQAAVAGAGRQEQVGNGFYQVNDLTLTFESEPNFQLAFESLDLPKSGINLLAVSNDAEGRNLATVRVPQHKVGVLLKKLEAYRDKDPNRRLAEGESPGRDNRKLVESISEIKKATLRQLWTDPAADYPVPGVVMTWEVWLRAGDTGETKTPDTMLRDAAADFGYTVVSKTLDFVDRSVALVRATLEQLSLGVDILGIIAEVRKAKTTAAYFDALPVAEQHARINRLNARVVPPAANSPVIALLDTGVNRGHPLLAPIILDANLHTHNSAWGVHDTWPHGTGMAGLALFGDLAPLFDGDGPVALRHRLESLKFVERQNPHPEDLYGIVTIEGVSRLEVTPDPRRLFCIAVTTDGKDRGRPSSWSAALDNLTSGVINDTRRLVIVSAGNALDAANYPADNLTSPVQDPAQSWNALTVGGTTDKCIVDERVNPGYTPLAEPGDLAPASTTSLIWPKSPRWPFKPDIVMEAGNMGHAPNSAPMNLAELSLLTTSDEFLDGRSPLTIFHDTSAATALASRLAASLWALYPDFTPETVRALMVHAARWTPAMLRRCTDVNGALNTTQLLRTFGHGVPNEQALFASANNALTLIAQGTLKPFMLANRSHIAVYPTQGWWKTRPKENRYDRAVPYSLVVSITMPDENTDIYTPVAQQIGVGLPVEIIV